MKYFFIVLIILQSHLSAQSADDRRVDELLKVLGTRETRKQGEAAFKQMGARAEKRLLFHIRNKTPEVWAVLSVDAFKYVWTENIKKMCRKTIQSETQTIATLTLAALFRHLPTEELQTFCDPILHKMHFSCGGPMFIYIQTNNPSKERLDRVVKNTKLWPAAAPFLCQYRGADVNLTARILLAKGNSIVKREAINALIFHGDNDGKLKKYIVTLLKSKDTDLRDRAAEYLRWYGDKQTVTDLQNALKIEKDLHTSASISAALEAIFQRQEMYVNDGNEVNFETSGKEFYLKAMTSLSEKPSINSRLAVIKRLKEETRHDSHYTYGRGEPVDKELYKAQYTLFRLIAGYRPLNYLKFESQPELKKPVNFFTVPPIPQYFNPARKSFGELMPPGSGPFADSHHVGDDCAWMQNLTPVVAIADGVVRYVEHTVSWGGIVIIEHMNEKGQKFCSLYGHLDPLICVKPGQRIKAGRKIASLGRSYKWENGGYAAHLHFGIHLGEFNTNWICGYISKNRFKMRHHKWTDPQKFIKDNLPDKLDLNIRLHPNP